MFNAWPAELLDRVDVCAVQLPGRANRVREAPYTSLPLLVRQLAFVLQPMMASPFALFGHSLGALLAYELARVAEERGYGPRHVFVSGRRAPHLPDDDPPSHLLSDDALIRKLVELKGTSEEVLAHPELLAVMLPTLRADFRMAETYTYPPGPPVSCPLTAFGGTQDEEAESDRLSEWRRHTSGAFAYHLLEGDHFFIDTNRLELSSLLMDAIDGILAAE